MQGGRNSPASEQWYDYLSEPPLWRTVGETWLVDRAGVINDGVCDFRIVAAQNLWLGATVVSKAFCLSTLVSCVHNTVRVRFTRLYKSVF